MKFNNLEKITIINFGIFLILFELVSALFLKDNVRKLYQTYLNFLSPSIEDGYPRFHFEKNDERGFDIAKSSLSVLSKQPYESDSYEVWGNSIGCFDNSIPQNENIKIYLAGDSYTWGYAPLKYKFGTILEEKLNKTVASCGVTHTGQLHQFSKFKDIVTQLNQYPEVVIVNVVSNDIQNDFVFPKTTVINGYKIDYKFFYKDNKDKFKYKLIDPKLLEGRFKKVDNKKFKFGINFTNPRQFSSTFVLIGHVYKILRNALIEKNDIYCLRGKVKSLTRCSFYRSEYPFEHEIASNNRKVINDWILNSKENNYRLIFTTINSFDFHKDYFKKFCNYINKKGSECHNFGDFLEQKRINKKEILWKYDGHFNYKGNKVYAEYLLSILKK